MTSKSPVKAFKSLVKLLSQYVSTSLFATVLDFGVFQIALSYFGATAVIATLFGRIVGSTTSFLIHKNWVFSHIQGLAMNKLVTKYFAGIVVGTILNLGGVWILNNIFKLGPWPSRIITATTVWFIVFTYNRFLVFKHEPDEKTIIT
jgi:putative flippase GtrA